MSFEFLCKTACVATVRYENMAELNATWTVKEKLADGTLGKKRILLNSNERKPHEKTMYYAATGQSSQQTSMRLGSKTGQGM